MTGYQPPQALVPWARIAEHLGGTWPDGLPVEVYDGDGEPPEDLSAVRFYVQPYAKGAANYELVRRMPALEAMQSLAAGVEKLLPLLPPGVVLCNGRGLHDASAAEHAVGLVLAAQRDIPQWVRQQGERRWDSHSTRSLAGSRVVLVGYGSIGAAIEARLLPFEVDVLRVAHHARPADSVHGIDTLPDLLPGADIVLLVLPETPATIGLFGAEELAALPDDALVVNIGRGRTVDTAALLAETASGRLRAALDVIDPEPLPADHPLWSLPNVLLTPHVAGGSATFYPRAERLVAEQLRRFAEGRPLLNVVRGRPDSG